MNIFFSHFRNTTFLFVAGLAAIVFIAFIPLFQGRFVMDDDATQYLLPAFKFYSDSLAKGESFDIAPQALSGFPFGLSYIGGFYDPLNLFMFKVFSYPFAYYFRIFLNYLLGAIFVFFLCRELKLSNPASLVAALAFLTAQDMQAGLKIIHSNSYIFLTGLFFVSARLFNIKNFKSLNFFFSFILGIAVFVTGMFGGAAQLNLESSVILFFFLLFLCWKKYDEEGKTVSVLKPLAASLAILAVGAVAFLPQLFRVLELVSFSDRHGGLPWAEAGGGLGFDSSIAPSFIYFFFPKTFQIPGIVEQGGVGYVPFIGAAALVSWAFFFLSARDKNWYFWAGLFLFSALSVLPYPLFWLMHKLPIFNLFRNPASWSLAVSFVMGVMSGLGYEEFRQRKVSSIGAGVVISSLLIGLISTSFFIIYHWPKGTLNILNPVSIQEVVLSLTFWLGTMIVACLCIYQQKPWRHLSVLLILLAIPSFLFPIWTKLFKDSTSLRTQSIFKSPWVYNKIRQYEKENIRQEPFRTFNFYSGDSQWFFFVKYFNPSAQLLADFQREVVRPNLYHLLDSIDSVRGYDNLISRRYKKMLAVVEGAPLTDWTRQKKDGLSFVEVPLQRLRVLGMMNVKYIWSILPPQDSLFDEHLKLLDQNFFKGYPYPLNLYLNKEFIPRVYSPSDISFLAEKENNFEEIILRVYDFKKLGFIECLDGCPVGTVASQIPPAIEMGKIQNNSITFSTEGSQGAWIIISNSFIPRWHAFIDDKETKIYYANYIYQGIRVPAGKHEIVLKYIR